MIHKALFLTSVLLYIRINTALEDEKLTFRELAIKYGGAIEEYDVTTADGYILKLFRIPGDKTKPVLYGHGLLGSSNDLLMRGSYSLPTTLANSGYDVWLLNYRGNLHSRRHVTLDPDTDKSFWQFGPHQFGYYDLAASIDFVLNNTGETKLSLIGHSESTMATYILGSERPEYNDKVKVFIGLAPVAHLHYIKNNFPKIEQFGFTVRGIIKPYKIEELGRYDSASGAMFRKICSHKVGIEACRYLAYEWARFQSERPEDIAYAFSNSPGGTSRMNLEHLFQILVHKRFANYDYGPVKNLFRYKSMRAPEYDLGRVSMRVYLFNGPSDILATIQDAEQQYRELPNAAEVNVLEDKGFSHLDFIWSRKAKQLLHPSVLNILQKYNM